MLNEDIENITKMLMDAAVTNAGVTMKIHNKLVAVGAKELLVVFQQARLHQDADETCTSCWDTGWNWASERVCNCQPVEDRVPPAPAMCDCERGHNGMGMALRECDCQEGAHPSRKPD